MEKIILKSTIKNSYRIYHNKFYIGKVLLYKNKYHLTNIYIKLKLKFYDCNVSKAIFSELENKIVNPMQIIISKEDEKLTEFVQTGGFVCKRKCCIVQASIDNFLASKNKNVSLLFCRKGDLLYKKLAKKMFEYYCKTHSEINPWTSNFSKFYKLLPKTIAYWNDSGQVQNFAFIENNEIAYIYGIDKCQFSMFAENLIAYFFDKYDKVEFESDDCDCCSQWLKDLFYGAKQFEYDTYIYC